MLASKKRDRDLKRLTDQELMDLVQAGDFSPASEIYDRYSRRIYNHAYGFVLSRETAEDITQEVFIKMIKSAAQFRAGAKLVAWLLAITANCCRDYLRKARTTPTTRGEEIPKGLAAPDEHSPERHVERNEAGKRIQQALSLLKSDQRETILLLRYQELTYAEIALILGCSEGAVKSRVFRAMEALKNVLTGDTEWSVTDV
jgi:RNA polymerase sigma-70 factor (ECF subfamily)